MKHKNLSILAKLSRKQDSTNIAKQNRSNTDNHSFGPGTGLGKNFVHFQKLENNA